MSAISTVITAADVEATADTFDVPTPDALRAALATANTAADATGAARDSLARIVLARYVATIEQADVRGSEYTGTLDGVRVLRDNHRADVAALLWLEATGSITAPKGEESRPGDKSMAQYIAKFGTVATSGEYGLEFLSGTDSANSAYADYLATRKLGKDAKADNAFAAFLTGLNPTDRKHWDTVIHALRTSESDHRAAFTRASTPAK